jgi:hypothetical protein
MGLNSEQYDCRYDQTDVKRVIISYEDEPLTADEKPLPGECPLRNKKVIISL